MNIINKETFLKKAANIKLAVFDVDGVLTDGRLILGENGNEYKCFHVRDGQGLVMLLESGCKIAIITARASNIVADRMRSLGIQHVYQNETKKGTRLLKLQEELGLEKKHIAYVGDDVIDLPAMTKAGLPIAVADAHPAVKDNALWITEQRGGQGAVRAICEMIIQSQGKLESQIATYLSS